jgi:hypothetical protein
MKPSKLLLVTSLIALPLAAWFLARGQQLHPYHWQRFESPDGKFTVDFPGTPVSRDGPITSGTGVAYISHSLAARASEHAAYGFLWWDDSTLGQRSPDAILDIARDRGILGVGGSLISEKKTIVRGYPAREIQASARGNATFDNRILLVGARLYSLIVIDTAGMRDRNNVEKFFDSFTPH